MTQDASRTYPVGPIAVTDAPARATHTWVFPSSLGRQAVFAGLGRHHQRQRGGWCAYLPVWGRMLERIYRSTVVTRAEGVYVLADEEIAEIILHEPDARVDVVHGLYIDHIGGAP